MSLRQTELNKQGLTLRLYPTSYPSSTVGGWLAQGGAGIGSYEYGYFRENVESAKVVLPSGDVKVFSGNELELIADAEGITGLIIEVTLRIQPREDIEVAALACSDANRLQELVNSIIESKLPIWSMVFINPKMAEMKNRAPLMEHGGHSSQERVILPASYILTLAFRKKDNIIVRSALPGLAKSTEAEIISDKIAEKHGGRPYATGLYFSKKADSVLGKERVK